MAGHEPDIPTPPGGHEEPNGHKPAAGYEQSDVNAFAIGRFGVAMVVVVVLCLGLVYGVFNFLLHREGGVPQKVSEFSPSGKLPPEPRLEVLPPQELKAIQDAEEKKLTSYGWVDKSKGVVRIPIERAIDEIAKRGFPTRPAAADSTAGMSMPTESGLGAKMQPAGGPVAGDSK